MEAMSWPPSAQERALAAELRELERCDDLAERAAWGLAAGDAVSDTDPELDDVALIESVVVHGIDPWSLSILMCIDPETLLDPIHRVRYLEAMDLVQSYVAAGQQRALVAVAGARSCGDLGTERHLEHEVAVARRSSRGRAGRDIELARSLREDFREAARALERGDIGLEHARALVLATRHVADAQARAEIERRVIPSASRMSPSRFRRHVDAAVCAVDAENEARRHARARGDRQVWIRRVENGLGELVVVDEWSTVSAMFARITAGGRELQRERRARVGTDADPGGGSADDAPTCGNEPWSEHSEWLERTLDNCRADTLSAIVLDDGDDRGPSSDSSTRDARRRRRRRGRPRIEGRLVIDLATLRGEADHPCLLDGSPVPAKVGRRVARDIAHWRRMVTDPVDGHLLDYGRRTYLPGALRDFVLERDQRCRNPWCDQPARRCQLDHATEFPAGPSNPANTGALCEDCHRIKTERGAFVDSSGADGSAVWRTAWGQRVPIAPTRYLDDGGAGRAPDGTTDARTRAAGPQGFVPGMLDRFADSPPRTRREPAPGWGDTPPF